MCCLCSMLKILSDPIILIGSSVQINMSYCNSSASRFLVFYQFANKSIQINHNIKLTSIAFILTYQICLFSFLLYSSRQLYTSKVVCGQRSTKQHLYHKRCWCKWFRIPVKPQQKWQAWYVENFFFETLLKVCSVYNKFLYEFLTDPWYCDPYSLISPTQFFQQSRNLGIIVQDISWNIHLFDKIIAKFSIHCVNIINSNLVA